MNSFMKQGGRPRGEQQRVSDGFECGRAPLKKTPSDGRVGEERQDNIGGDEIEVLVAGRAWVVLSAGRRDNRAAASDRSLEDVGHDAFDLSAPGASERAVLLPPCSHCPTTETHRQRREPRAATVL
jgi:hypothetical protein